MFVLISWMVLLFLYYHGNQSKEAKSIQQGRVGYRQRGMINLPLINS